MGAVPEAKMTAQEYLSWERSQEVRHEYIHGEVFAMTGASRAHNLICGNIAALLHAGFRGRPCEVYISDMRVKVDETGTYTYPDIAALCEAPRFEDAAVDTLINPSLIIEILSDSTERYDRGAKFAHYRRLPSLEHYLLVAQAEYRIEHYTRQPGDRWLLTEYIGLDEEIALPDLACRLPLSAVYERIALADRPGDLSP